MSKIAQYFDYIDLRPPQGVSKSEVFLKRPPPKPPPFRRSAKKPPKTTKNGQFLAVFRASGPKHPYSSRSKGGPPQGASPKMVKKGPKMTQNRPFWGVERPPKSHSEGSVWRWGAAREGRPRFVVQKGRKRASQTPNWGSQTLDRGPPDPLTPKNDPFWAPPRGCFYPPWGRHAAF